MTSQIESQSPFFQFFPNDWLSSKKMARMSLEEQGAYMRLLCFTWADKDCSIEDDDQALADYSTLGERWFNGCGTKIKKCFIEHPEKKGFLTNQRLLEERIKQAETRRKNSRAGKISAKKRVEKMLQEIEPGGNSEKEKLNEVQRAFNGRSQSVPTEDQQNSTLRFSDFGFQFSDFSFQEREGEDQIKKFLRFARESHKAIRGSPLRIKPKQNAKTVRDMLSDIPIETMMVAWILFLQSDHRFILENQKPRNIPVFAILVDDFLEPAAKALEREKQTHDPPKKPEIPLSVDPDQTALWGKCLEKIEEQILPENFKSLFGFVTFGGIDSGKAKIICPNENYSKAIAGNYLELIENVLPQVFREQIKPEFILEGKSP